MSESCPADVFSPLICKVQFISAFPFIVFSTKSICVVFRAQMREKHLARRTEADLNKGQKSCRQLDLARDFTEPVEAWFWPPDPKERLLQVADRVSSSVADPNTSDPYVFGPSGSGSGSNSQRFGSGSGSGSFYHQAKIVRKTVIPTIL
jgi:hypothetical protein